MLKIASRYGLKHSYHKSTGPIVRLFQNGAQEHDEAELPKHTRIVICGSGLAGSRYFLVHSNLLPVLKM